LNTSCPQEKKINTIYCVRSVIQEEKRITGSQINEKQFTGRQKKRRAITIKEGTKIVIDPSFPLMKRGE
jgi:hypothetical protein